MDPRWLTAAYYGPGERLELLSIDRHGTVKEAWKKHNGPWHEPVARTAQGFAQDGAPLAAVASQTRDQFEVFVVDANGAISVVWQVGDGLWPGHAELTPRGSFQPRFTGIAGIHYLPYDQMEVFAVDTRGVLQVVWKERNDPWKPPVALTSPGFAPSGASVAAVSYPVNNRLEAFAIGTNGAVRGIGKDHNKPWGSSIDLTGPGLGMPGASVAAVYYPPQEQLFVFFVDTGGALRGIWKEHDGSWNGPFILSFPGLAPPGAAVAAAHYAPYDQVEVFIVDGSGAVRVAFRTAAGNWHPPASLIPEEFAVAGASLAVSPYPLQNQFELFTTSRADVLHGIAKVRNGWWGPCAFPIEPQVVAIDQTRPQLLGTVRAGQLTGSIDPQNKWLFNYTQGWGVPGVDLGANTVHDDNRLHIFFGDVPRGGRTDGPAQDTDLVASLNGLHLAGHEAAGFNFVLPHDDTPVDGQRSWRFCVKCHAIYFDGYPVKGVCSQGGTHAFHPQSYEFALPHDNTPVDGQRSWRFCVKCFELFFDGYDDKGVCPHGGPHRTHPDSYQFVLPHDATPVEGQREWRFCRRCYALFYDGYPDKGVCSAGGVAFTLTPVMNGPHFAPFKVSGPIGELLTNETPTGAFSYGGRVWVFIWVGHQRDQAHPAGSYLVSKGDPHLPGPFREEFLFSPLRFDSKSFWQVAPVVVSNAEHPGLPRSTGDGLIVFGHGADAVLGTDAVHLAWMPLREGVRSGPVFEGVQYFTDDPDPARRWSPNQDDAVALFRRPRYTSVSAAWLEGPRRWVVLYSKANEAEAPTGAVVAHFGPTPWDWSDEVELFNPCVEGAFTKYMHWPWRDDIRKHDPPGLSHLEDHPGWAYGAFLMQPFTQWNNSTRELNLYYLLSLSSPYQVQVMFSRVRLPE